MKKVEQVVFAAGCFWCTEAVFQRIKGVAEVIPGYSGGKIKNPAYREVCMGLTGHAEGVMITYDPSIVSFEELLVLFFATHDPTTLNRQGNDVGTQYRSEIFYSTSDQKEQALSVMERLETEKVYSDPIVTKVSPLQAFYKAEPEHHDFYNQHTEQPYCQYIISPKIQKLRTYYSNQLKETNG